VTYQVRAKIEGEVGDEETLIVSKWREDNGKPRCDYYLSWNNEPTDLYEYARVIKHKRIASRKVFAVRKASTVLPITRFAIGGVGIIMSR